MNPVRTLTPGVLLLGLATALAFHAGGALDVRDALTAATLSGGVAGSPPAPLTARVLGFGVDLVRVAWAPTGTFRAMHLAAGLLLAVAAALSSGIAARSAGRRPASPVLPGLAGGLAVGLVALFAPDVGGAALRGSPIPLLLALLAGSAAAWTAPRPRALLGGLLLGLAVAEHPAVLFLLPAWGGLAMGAPLRLSPEESRGFVRRALAGGGLGLAAFGLTPLASAGRPLLDVGDPGTLGAAVAAWAGDPAGAFWAFAPLGSWGGRAADLALLAWRNAGPLGIVVAVAGVFAFFSGRASRLRPFLVAHAVLALAAIVGEFRDAEVAAALTAWSFLFWMAPAFEALSDRFGAGRAAIAGVAVGAAVLAPSIGEIDRSAEADVDWARASFDALPTDALLVTRNPVHLALASEGGRPDLRILYPPGIPAPESRALPAIVSEAAETRPVILDAGVFFDPIERATLLGSRWRLRPWGPAFRIEPLEGRIDPAGIAPAKLPWDAVDPTPGSPASPLREGLTGSEYFARALLQSASLYQELGFRTEAERDFLIALSHPDANRTLAAYGLAQTLYRDRFYEESVRTVRWGFREEDPGAWMAARFLASALLRTGDREAAVREMDRALALVPPEKAEERRAIRRTRDQMRQGTGSPKE